MVMNSKEDEADIASTNVAPASPMTAS
eukprot:COSAG06_NODE_15966_length_1032_cov_1.079314_1_plen_26_part_10